MRERVQYFDLMRCVAAIAVIAIHVLAPYRQLLGDIPFGEWLTAVTVNGVSRWAVPVFILITGALMLSDTRPFDFHYYVKRRLGKVLVPFLVWSLFYAYLSGWSLNGFDADIVKQVLIDSYHHATYYHLGFFYYFIPLYFVIPLFQLYLRHHDENALLAFILIWLFTTLLYLLGIDGMWSHQLWLYSGYLPLGYWLYKRVANSRLNVMCAVLLGITALACTVVMVVDLSLSADKYTVGRWLSYKTLNVVLAATMVFIVCRYLADYLSEHSQKVVSFISKHSLGIYIVHPIFLWPMKQFEWYQGNPLWVIPCWIFLSGGGALVVSWLLARSNKTRWLLP